MKKLKKSNKQNYINEIYAKVRTTLDNTIVRIVINALLTVAVFVGGMVYQSYLFSARYGGRLELLEVQAQETQEYHKENDRVHEAITDNVASIDTKLNLILDYFGIVHK